MPASNSSPTWSASGRRTTSAALSPPRHSDRRFNGYTGWNGAYIELPYYPILEITSVTEYWGVSGPHVLVEQTPTSQSSQDSFQCDYLHGILIRTFPGLVQRPWFPGSRNIEVTWTAGYNPIPADIRLASLEYIKFWWVNTQQQSGNRPGNLAGEYDASGPPGLYGGVPHILEDVFDSYIQVGMG